MKSELLEFQKTGVQFLLKAKRCLLCDEMGLGKTVQSLAALEQLFENEEISKALILCPSSIKKQWMSEIQKFTDLTATQIDATKNRTELYAENKQIYVINYKLFIKDAANMGIDKTWAIVCDEASKLKNPKTKIHKFVSKYTQSVRYFWCLTGTPIENNLQNLYTLVNLVKPFFMLWNEFTNLYCEINTYYFRKKYIKRIDRYKRLDHFLSRIQHLFLRRKAEEVDLPTVTINNIFFDATKQQLDIAKDLKWFIDATEKTKFEILTLLRGLDNTPELLNTSESLICKSMKFAAKPIIAKEEPKIDRVQEILEETSEEKILIFTQFKQMTILLKNKLFPKYDVAVLYGGMPQEHKEHILHLFETKHTGKKMVLICTDMLAYGQNLQYINLIINFDLPWNPAILAQRIGRIRRMNSESKHKHVINLIGSLIDYHVFQIIDEKQNLFDQVVNGGAILDKDVRKEVLERVKL